MQELVREYLGELRSKRRKRRRICVAVTLLVVMVTGSVIGTLIQHGVAMTGDLKCGIEEHTHSDACYEDILICGQEENTGHTHTDACYQTEYKLICGLEESGASEESEGHVHTEECYMNEQVLICGQEESTGHTHTDACYEEQLICGKEEHIHTDACYIDTTADVEDSSIWDEQYKDTEWEGAWGEDLVIAAKKQIGYKESKENYTVAKDGSHKGYTRYGQFAGDVYADWDAMFVNFCMHYAGLEASNMFPDEKITSEWYDKFIQENETNQNYIVAPDGYEPEVGDLVFFNKEGEETAFQMGIVSSYNKENHKIKVVEGNVENEVKESEYDTGLEYIAAYLRITELERTYKNQDEPETSEPEISEDDIKVPAEGEKTETGSEDQKKAEETIQNPEEVTPKEEQEQEQEPPADYVECLTIAALDELKEDETGSAAEDYGRADIEDDNTANSGWVFDTYYVNQDDRYDVLETSDFNLKYQMEFHTSKNFRANEISIRVERRLFDYRNQDPVLPDQIAVPQVIREEDNEYPVESNNMPFNYRIIADEDGTEYLEFFNYKDIPAGSNVAWQILYKNLNIMKITDEEEWTIHPEIIIWDTDDEENVLYGTEKVKRSTTPLKGKVDSSVRLTNVTKKEYHESGKQYTPELYTVSQVRAYTENISLENENKFFQKDQNGKEILNDDYYYAVWEVTMKGAATQPWKIQITETPSFKGEIVGYKDNYNEAKGYDVKIDSGKALTEGIAVEENERTSWSSRFYVVTAYPVEDVTPDETDIENTIEITAVPCDGKDESEKKKASSEFTYKKFDWTYPDDAIGVEKKSNDKEDYTGWLEVYSQVKDDYGDIGFTSLGEFRGYGLTHYIEGEQLGQYKEGTSYKLITADDFMYVVDGEDYIMLEKEDYYYSGVTITQREQGYDIWEDAITSQPEKNGDVSDQDVKIYAMYGDGSSDEWELVKEIPWNDSGVMSYSFTPEDLARKPYRVKAEHVATNYRTTCEIKVNVRIRKDSPVMNKIMKKYEDGDLSFISFEDLSGVIAQNKINDKEFRLTPVKRMEGTAGNYSEPGLLEATQKLYDELKEADETDTDNFPMYRDNAYKKVTGLESHANSTKAVTSITNDVINRRGQVIYSLTAQDGYEIFSEEAVTELKRQGMESPGRQDVVFYDLLPEGMIFDPSYPVRAGRITNFDKKGNYTKQPGLWDSGQVEVTWETKDNYNGTSRTMVIFHIKYKGEDAAVYSNRSWLEGWGVSFRAYYDWEDTGLIEKGTNISAFMPDKTDPHYGDPDYPLCGKDTEVAKDDGVIVPEDYKDVYQDFGANIDGNTANDDIRNVLYADNDESEDIAQSYSSAITKLVRADEDKYSSYRTSAVVEENGYYTYDIKVTTGTSELKNIIVYDHLENAAADRGNNLGDPNSGFADANWEGTLQSVMTSGLNKLGVEPVVYYSEDRDALTPKSEQLADIESLEEFKDSKGTQIWYKETEFKNSHGGSLEAAKSIAVDLRKTTDGEDFILAAESAVSFQIKMKAPVISDNSLGYAYNCPMYYSTTKADVDNSIQYGDSVKVGIKKAASLAVIKEFGSDVPDSVKDTAFEFCLTDKRDEKNPKPFSYQVYRLYKKNADGTWKSESEAGQYATDGNGLLELHADEKAVFENIPDVSEIEVKETENIFWKSETADVPADESNVRTVTVTNTYRPVLYIEKKLEGVPKEIDIEEVNPEFTFMVQAEKEGNLSPLKDQEYYYVKEARTDGGIPRIDTEKGDNGKGKTDSNGRFNIYKGEIIAVFPGNAGTKYEVKEVSNEKSDNDWICREDTVTGQLPVRGTSVSIRNYYRWRELYLTKEITHDTGICDEAFTFQIQKVEKEDGTEKVRFLTQEEIDRLELVMGFMMDGEFMEVSGDMNGSGMEDGDAGEMLRMKRSLNGTIEGNGMLEMPEVSDNRIVVDLTGTFTCNCANMTIRIRGLEAGETYRITEIVNEGSLYLPEQGTVDVSMPLYGDNKEVTITNDYQRRPLSISKTVVSSTGEVEDDTEFTMQIFVNGEPLVNYPYMIQDSGEGDEVEEMPEGGQGILSQGGSQSMLSLEEAEYLPGQSNSRGIIGSGMGEEIFPQIATTDEEGKIKLKSGQTAILIDAGKLGDEFKVVEESTEGYQQIAPSGDGEGIFSGEGAEVAFVNAKEGESKSLYISKVYEAENFLYNIMAVGYVEELKRANGNGEETATVEKGSVEVTLTIDKEIYTGPESKEVTVVNQLTGETSIKQWDSETFILDPWSIVIIPIEDEAEEIEYTLSESKDDQHQIVNYLGSWLEISQKDPKNDRPVEGTVTENPIATITNEVKTVVQTSLVTKQMTEDSSEVPEGAELVWRVEKFNGAAWEPAEDVSYITLEGNWSDDLSNASVIPTCDRILKTGPDGRIVLTKSRTEDGVERWPAVYFTENVVNVNEYKDENENDYRVVEVMEESDEAWGMLKEYTVTKKNVNGNSSGLDLSYLNNAGGFVNSNENAPIEIAKEMDEDSDDTFTMILKQVLSLAPGVNVGNITEDDIIASEGRAGIPYTVYNTATGEVIAEKETGKNGEIQLKAGQYARLNLSNTLWTVSEEVGYTYKLKSLTPENGTKLKRLSDNLMLINCEPTYTVTYIDHESKEVLQKFTGLKKGDPTPEFEPKKDGYVFTGWTPEVADTVTGSVTYEANWRESYNCKVIYTDGVSGEVVFPDQGYDECPEGTQTPEYEKDGKDIPERNGYVFMGWDPEVNPIVSADDADESLVIIYTATWRRKEIYTISYNIDDKCIATSKVNENANHTILLPTDMPKDKEFVGWAEEPGGAVLYKVGDRLTVTRDYKLYAVWKE